RPRARLEASDEPIVRLIHMSFVKPAMDLEKMKAAWEAWERGEEQPGKTLANLKTAGLDDLLAQLVASGWKPQA
ncbi:MAG: hypothetical protein ACKOQZ_09380, partial [Actinomycetota bacterium]